MQPTISVVVPAYDVAGYLDECLSSLLSSQDVDLEVIVVNDGSTDATGAHADAWAERDGRVRVLHTANGGLGAARNAGASRARGTYLGFCDADDVVPPTGYAALVRSLEASGSDFACGSLVRWTSDGLDEPPWMRRLHSPARRGITVREHPEILGDVFAPTKVFRRSFWDAEGLSWPTGVRYEDQPTTTRAFLAGTFDVLPDVVYHWRIREDGTSITQQRASLPDLTDRWTTKRWSWESVRAYDDPEVTAVFRDRVLAGDLWRYFLEIPTASDAWWTLLRSGIAELWGDRSLVHSGLPPVHRLAAWLVEQDRRDEVGRLMRWVASLDGPAPRVRPRTGVFSRGPERIDVPADVVDLSTVAPAALALRDHELG